MPEEGSVPARRPVAVIGYGFWRSTSGPMPRVVGRTDSHQRSAADRRRRRAARLQRDGQRPEFRGLRPGRGGRRIGGEVGGSRALLEGNRTTRWLAMMGRLAPGSTCGWRRAELETVAARLASAYADSNRGIGFVAEPIRNATYGASSRFGTVVVALFAAVGLALLWPAPTSRASSSCGPRPAGRDRAPRGPRRDARPPRATARNGEPPSLVHRRRLGLLLRAPCQRADRRLLPAGIPLPLDLEPAVRRRASSASPSRSRSRPA